MPPLFKKLGVQGATAVVRDDRGKVVATAPLAERLDRSRDTWRSTLRKLTNNGEELFVVLYNLAQGAPYKASFEGKESEPIIPSPEVRRAAATDLLHMLHGKPVAQTEVVKSEVEAQEMQRYQAMSREELLRIAGLEGAHAKRGLPPERETDAVTTAEGEDGDEG